MSVRFQPFDPSFLQDPYATYAELRAESPVHRIRMGPIALLGLLRRFSAMRRAAGAPGLVRTAWQLRRARAQQEAHGGSSGGVGSLRRRLYAVSRSGHRADGLAAEVALRN